jgi:xylose isomerase
MGNEYFPGVEKIKFVGKGSKELMGFKHYDPEAVIEGKKMKEHLRFSIAYWHTFCADGKDMFGAPVFNRSWDRFDNPLDASLAKADAAFEFMSKLGAQYFCFHDRDLAPELDTLRETNALLDKVVAHVKELMKETGIKLLWGTANMFTAPKFMHGAFSSPSYDVLAYSGAQVKKALEVTKELGGENYVFWGGREGYETLLNTNISLETAHIAAMFRAAQAYAKEIGFEGTFLIEPKPKEPTKHQYDYDAATAQAFLKTNGIEGFKFNIEANHATLAGHTFQHELRYCRENDVLGSVDANMGDMLLGWDTDQFPTNVYDTTLAMYEILKNGGITPGGLNFDAHVRRGSYEKKDLFFGHIAGMDAFAIGLKVAAKLIEDQVFENFVDGRYKSFTAEREEKLEKNNLTLSECEDYIIDRKVEMPSSGRQEMLETILNDYLFNS